MDQVNLFKEYEEVLTPALESINPKKEKIYSYNPFALQDAVGEKSVKKIWIEYEKLRLAGIEAEELIHKIVSKVRDMTAITMGASKEDLAIKDYPYKKSKRDARNWKEEDLKNLYTKLVKIYHHSRMSADQNNYSVGQREELDVAIEKTLLNI